MRRQDPDYSLDLAVEIFEDGRATADSFAVQLKATDQEDVGVALRSLRFPRDTAEYYWAQPVPVLIVRWHAPTGQLYARWWHAYNPLIAARPDAEDQPAEPTKTVGFVFSDEDRWTADNETVREITEGVRAFRRLRSPELPLPVRFLVSGGDGVDDDVVIGQLAALRAGLRSAENVVSFDAGRPRPGEASILLAEHGTQIALGDVASVTLDHQGLEADRRLAAANIGCAVGLAFVTVGQPNLAAQVASACAARSTTITGLHAAWTLAGAFFRAGRTSDVLDLIDELTTRDDFDSRIAAFILQTAVLARGLTISDADARRAVDVARHNLHARRQGGDNVAAAGAAFNLAASLAQTGEWAEAAETMQLAAVLNPHYPEQAYLLRDLATFLFASDQFDEAATTSEEARRLDPSFDNNVLVADSLMYAGRYAEAAERFERAIAARDEDPAGAIWRLKMIVLDDVRALVGDVQRRAPEEAERLARQVDFLTADISIDQAWTLIEQALALDGLSGVAHHRRSILSLRVDEDDQMDASAAATPAISAAVLSPWDEGHWVNAIRIASASGQSDRVVYDLARSAVKKTGDDVVAQVLAVSDSPLKRGHRQLLDRAARDVAEERQVKSMTLGFRSPGGHFNTIVIGGSTGGE